MVQDHSPRGEKGSPKNNKPIEKNDVEQVINQEPTTQVRQHKLLVHDGSKRSLQSKRSSTKSKKGKSEAPYKNIFKDGKGSLGTQYLEK